MSDLIERLRQRIVVDGMEMPGNDSLHREAADELERLNAVLEAAEELKEAMIKRADLGTHDGDHSVQAGNSVWYNFCEAIQAAREA